MDSSLLLLLLLLLLLGILLDHGVSIQSLGNIQSNFFEKWVTWVGGKTVECGSLAKALSFYSSVSEKMEQL
jgi:hypothetical protein